MNISDYEILYTLFQDRISCAIDGYTVNQLSTKTQYSLSKCRNAIKLLTQAQFVNEGAMNKNSKTYYISTKGIEEINRIQKERMILNESN